MVVDTGDAPASLLNGGKKLALDKAHRHEDVMPPITIASSGEPYADAADHP